MNNIYPWQQDQWQYLYARIEQGSLPHALLLTGIKHIGKLNFAKTFAERLLCQQPNVNACGQCRSCQWITAGTHPDLLFIQPEAEGKHIKIEQIRQLIDDVSKTSHQNHYHIVIIEPAETMNIASANALLKTLEEPTQKTLFILVSDQIHLLPATVRSRCQILQFPTPNHNIACTWLSQELSTSENIELLMRLAEGAPLKALSLAKPSQFSQENEIKIDLIKIALQQLDPLTAAAAYAKKLEVLDILHIFYALIIDLIKFDSQVDTKFFLNPHIMQELPRVQCLSKTSLLRFLEKILILKNTIHKTNLNAQLLLENLFIDWKKLFEKEVENASRFSLPS
jgi:DNA polymerase III subunit delta'